MRRRAVGAAGCRRRRSPAGPVRRAVPRAGRGRRCRARRRPAPARRRRRAVPAAGRPAAGDRAGRRPHPGARARRPAGGGGRAVGRARRTRASADRHDTMRATIEVSTRALAPGEHAFFRRLGVFTGPVRPRLGPRRRRRAGSDRVASMDVLATLVERSLVTIETVGPTHALPAARAAPRPRPRGVARRRRAGIRRRSASWRRCSTSPTASSRDAAEQWDAATAPSPAASSSTSCGPASCAWNVMPLPTAPTGLCCRCSPRCTRGARTRCCSSADGCSTAGRTSVHRGEPRRWPCWPPRRRSPGATRRRGPLAAAVVDDPEASPIAAALADRAWGLATRAVDHAAAVRHFRLARMAASDIGARSLMHELQVFEAGEVDLAGDRDARPGRCSTTR